MNEMPQPTTPRAPHELALDFAGRAIRADLSNDTLRDDEAAALEDITDSKPAMVYLAWRRCALWTAGVALGASVVLGLPTLAELFDQTPDEFSQEMFGVPQATPPVRDLFELDQGLSLLLLFAVGFAAFALVQAARRWTDIKASVRLGRLAVLSAVGGPLALSMIPWTRLVDWDWLKTQNQDPNATAEQITQQIEAASSSIGLLFAFALFIKVGPAVIGLCSGIIRSSATLKTFLPESFLPGWTIAAFTPVYAILMITVVILLNQTSGDWMLIAGVAALIAGPGSYLTRAATIMAPVSKTDTQALASIRALRQRASLFYVAGTALIGFWVYSKMDLGFLDGVAFVLSAMGSAMTMTVVAADLQLALIGRSWRQLHAIRGSELETELEARLEDFERIGLS